MRFNMANNGILFGIYQRIVSQNYRMKALLLGLPSETNDEVPFITSGSGVPSDTMNPAPPPGSIWFRRDASTGATLIYAYLNGAWSALSAVVGSTLSLATLTTTSSTITDTISERTSAAGVTIDGLRVKDAAITPVAGGAAFADLSNCATGEADVILGDNLADAMTVRQGANPYQTFVSTNGAERVNYTKPVALPVQTIDMADAAVTLVLSDSPGAGEVKLTGQVLAVDPNSGGAGENLTLPAFTGIVGIPITIKNTGGENVVLKDSAANTLVTIGSGASLTLVSYGSDAAIVGTFGTIS